MRDCGEGWVAGQHVRLRIFFSTRVFESHPLTIVNAPPSTSCSPVPEICLAAKVNGDWTKAVNAYAQKEQKRLLAEKEVGGVTDPFVQVMIDGPYGGCGLDLGDYERALLCAGGSGATFTLAILDDIVGRCVKLGRNGGEATRTIEFVWCIPSFGAFR